MKTRNSRPSFASVITYGISKYVLVQSMLFHVVVFYSIDCFHISERGSLALAYGLLAAGGGSILYYKYKTYNVVVSTQHSKFPADYPQDSKTFVLCHVMCV